ncbi:MAG TPA: alpha/beta hydrolase-fold protein [Dinghuibacter sp.]|uniref:alpha/beta hydrolase-fold protein n=1 Tax=Dinghuibacter sp. TaxID=2024697 RepID=UPI002C143FEA|nr:alpha/beta hydrolase-fold protein [Dinghuibacter sp.]HTJ14695.1 alpha/beta hydrolase-fold protein [Dinghuibacter sp.]
MMIYRAFFLVFLVAALGAQAQDTTWISPPTGAGPGYEGQPAYFDRTHFSKVFGHDKYYRVYLPEGYDHGRRRYPVIYFFHGWGGRHYMDDNAKLDYVALKGVVDKYQVILVMWDGNIDLSERRPYNVGNHEDVKFSVQMKDYFPELSGYVDSAYRTLADRGHRGVIGFSMGGFMSLFLSGKYPDKVCAVASFAGSPEFFVGYPDNQTLYPVRYTFANLRQVDTRIRNGNSDILYGLNREVHAGALWDEQAPVTYREFDGGHMIDRPGETAAFDTAVAFITHAFKRSPAPPPTGWSHYDPYPCFDVWGYSVCSDKHEPGFQMLRNVDKSGFGYATYRWLPRGPAIEGVHATVTTAAGYKPGASYQVSAYGEGRVTEQSVTADAHGRLTLTLDGDAEVGISTDKDPAEWVYLDFSALEHDGRNAVTGGFLLPGPGNRLDLRLFNRGGWKAASGHVRVDIRTADTSVHWIDTTVEADVTPGDRLLDLPPFLVACYKTPPPHGEPADIRFHITIHAGSRATRDEFTVPVFFDAPTFDSIRVDDGRRVRDSSYGTGNNNGLVDAGERIMLYQGRHRLRLYTRDPYVITEDERLADEDLPARWPDGFTLSSVVHVSPNCPDGHKIVFLANYETKTFNPIFRDVTWGRATVTVHHTAGTPVPASNPLSGGRPASAEDPLAGGRKVLMDDFFGVNVGNCTADPREIAHVAGWIRDYSNWPWLQPEKGQYRFTDALGRMNYDAYYRSLDSQHIKSLFVVQQTPKWVSGSPVAFAPAAGQDGLHPEQYTDAASFFYQLTARYGSRKTGNALTRDKVTGLNLMNAIEVYNEPDGGWGQYMSLAQYAALLNAAYDGNGHTMKGAYGIKTADPDMVVSIGGLANNLHSLQKIVAYAGRAPFDVINAHYYTFQQVREDLRVSVAPEWSSLVPDMREMYEWARDHTPGKPLWLTEIGWDTKDHSPEYVSEQDAANYLIRSYLLALGVGVEKVFWFIWSDIDDTEKPIVFTSSGLFENAAAKYKPKLTYWYNRSFKQWLTGYYYDANRSFAGGDSTVYDYRFVTQDGKKRMAVLWYCPPFQYYFRPTEGYPGSVVYDFALPDTTWRVTRVVRPSSGTADGIMQPYHETHDGIRITLEATPIFIEIEHP